jgi:hypothetical protein
MLAISWLPGEVLASEEGSAPCGEWLHAPLNFLDFKLQN